MIALIPRELPRQSGAVTTGDCVRSAHDAHGRLLVTVQGKVWRRRGYTEAWESIIAAVPKLHGLEIEASGAAHIRGVNSFTGAWLHLVSEDGGGTWHLLT